MAKLMDKQPDNNPMQLKYMRQVRAVLHYVNGWPHRALGKRVPPIPFRHPVLLFTLWILTWLTCMFVVKKNIGLSIIELGECYITILLNMIGMYRVVVSWQKKFSQLTKDFITSIHLSHFQWKSEKFKKMNEYVDIICKLFVYLLMLQLPCAIFLYNMPSVVLNYRAGMYSLDRPVNGTFKYAFRVTVPYFNIYTSLPTYIIVVFIELYMTTDCAICYLIFDLFIAIIVFHLWGHLKVLIYNLNNFPRPACDQLYGHEQQEPLKYSAEEQEIVTNMLVENIKHHQILLRFMKDFKATFGTSYALYYLCQQINLCISLLACSTMNTSSLLKYGMMTILITQQLIQVSLVVELIGSQSELLKDAVYSVPWECMSLYNRKIVAYFLLNVQRSFNVKGMDMVPVGVRTMAAILKSSISYFMLLRTIAMEENK